MSRYSNNGSKYVITFVDRKSRYVRVDFIKRKSEATQRTKNFINWVRTQRGEYPKNFNVDGGGEYKTIELITFCERLGINLNQTEAYSPNQNGIAERINRTLVEGTFALLNQAGMSDSFWEEAMEYFVFVKNRVPHSHLEGGRPIDEWNKELREVDREDIYSLHPFGCRAEVHIPPNFREGGRDGKKTRTCIYLGKPRNRKTDKFWDVERDKIIFGHANYYWDNEYPLKKNNESKSNTKNTSNHTSATGILTLTNNQNNASLLEERNTEPNSERTNSDSEMNNTSDIDIEVERKHNSSGDDDNVSNIPTTNSRSRPSRRATENVDYTTGTNLKTRLRNLDGKSTNVGYTGLGVDNTELEVDNAEIENNTNEEIALVASTNNPLNKAEKLTRSKVLNLPSEKKDKFISDEINEIESGFKTGCFEQVDSVPPGTQIYGLTWVYKVKPKTELEPERYRSRLCVLGNKQRPDSYGQTFASVAKVKTFRVLVAICLFLGMKMTQLDVSNAFMYADLDRDIYVHPPPGYEHLGILKLNKSLYGLKQAPRLWYETMKEVLLKMGFKQLSSDVCCFTHETEWCFVLMFVDDICIVAKDNDPFRNKIVETLRKMFKLRHYDETRRYLGLQVDWSEDQVKIYQKNYIESMLKTYNLSDGKSFKEPIDDSVKLSKNDPVSLEDKKRPYRSLVGALLYTLGSRPDVASAVRTVSQYVEQGGKKHWLAAKRILRYLSGTRDKGVIYTKDKQFHITAYCDSDHASEEDRKSISGYVVYMQNGAVVWKSKKQPIVTLSSCEAEYVALSETIKELLWLSMLTQELGIKQSRPLRCYIDNQAAKKIAENDVNHERTKHIDIRYHFIRQWVTSGKVELYYINTKENVSDLLTKATTRSTFANLVDKLVQ